jgi:antitoxin component YwqK of YwqJK toxin-antitoxin module
MKKVIVVLSCFLSLTVVSQIKCEHLKCAVLDTMDIDVEDEKGLELLCVKGEKRLEIVLNSFGEDSTTIPDVNGVYQTYYKEVYTLIPYSGCIKECENGIVVNYSNYEKGLQNDTQLSFSQNGECIYIGSYYNGKPIGEHNYYSSTNKLKKTINYDQNGLLHGKSVIYSEKTIETITYEHDNIIERSIKKVKSVKE